MAFLGTAVQSNHSQHSQHPSSETAPNGDTQDLTNDHAHEEQATEGGIIDEDSGIAADLRRCLPGHGQTSASALRAAAHGNSISTPTG